MNEIGHLRPLNFKAALFQFRVLTEIIHTNQNRLRGITRVIILPQLSKVKHSIQGGNNHGN
jgi:hypothetical protein